MKLKELEESGWEIEKSDKDRIVKSKRDIEINKTVDKIAESIIALTSAAKDLQKSNYDSNMKVGIMLMSKIDDLKKIHGTQKWVFNIERGTMGFISKITAERE